jgi:Cu(I)/Ag(I) efflux system protein CusF
MKLIRSLGVASFFVAANVALAHGPGTHGQPAETKASASSTASTFAGQIRKMDKAARSVTLQHDAVPSLKIPKATTAYPVSDPAILDKVKTGDKVLLTADKVDGVITVTAIETAK